MYQFQFHGPEFSHSGRNHFYTKKNLDNLLVVLTIWMFTRGRPPNLDEINAEEDFCALSLSNLKNFRIFGTSQH